MEKIKTFLESNYIAVIVFLTLMLVVSNCSSNKSVDKLRKEIDNMEKEYRLELDSIHTTLKNTTTIEQVQAENEQLLYQFLVFEDDLDKGKISMSEIKLKLEELNK